MNTGHIKQSYIVLWFERGGSMASILIVTKYNDRLHIYVQVYSWNLKRNKATKLWQKLLGSSTMAFPCQLWRRSSSNLVSQCFRFVHLFGVPENLLFSTVLSMGWAGGLLSGIMFLIHQEIAASVEWFENLSVISSMAASMMKCQQ